MIARAPLVCAEEQTNASNEEQQPISANQFRDAVRSGNIELVRSHLAKQPALANTPDRESDSKYPPLHYAVIDGHFEIARLLLKNGAKVDAEEPQHGTTAIFYARSAEFARLLLENGADFKRTARDSKRTPFSEAVNNRYMEVVKIFLEFGEKLDFEEAVQLGQIEVVAGMLQEKPWLAKPPRKPLLDAAEQGNLDLCKLLIEHGADPNIDYGFINVSGPYTALTASITSGNYEVSKLLFEHGAKPNVSGGRNHDNLLLFAIAYLDARFVKLMLEHDADVQGESDWGRGVTPLHVAAALGGAAEAGKLLRWGQPNGPEKEKSQALEKVRLLLEFKAEVGASSQDGATPLLFGAIAENREVCELLLANGAKLDIYSACLLGMSAKADELLKANPEFATAKGNPLGRSLLHWAARTGDLALTQHLLERGADPNAKAPMLEHQDAGGFSVSEGGGEMETPLHVAAQFGNEKIARLLIEKGADLKAESANRATALHHACARGDVKLVQLLLEKGAKFELNENASDLIYASDNDEVFGMLLDSVDQKRLAGPLGTEVLASIAQTTRKHAIELLLARGAKPDIFTACRLGQLEHVRAAVEANPSVIKTISGAMELAAVNGHVEVLEYLISKGAEIDPAKLEGISLLHSAAAHGHQQVLDLLIRQGSKLDGRTEQGATLLHAAATGVQTEIVRFLLSQGADVHAVDFSRNTPLHVLCGWQSLYDESERSKPKIIEHEVATARLFIEAGADVNAKDNLGCTPLHVAAGYGRVELAELLIAARANVNARNHRNETPLKCVTPFGRGSFSARDVEPVAELLRRHGATL